MDLIFKHMLYINIIILIAGATSIHLGASFLKREMDTKGFFKYSVFLLALGNGLCCVGYSIMSLSANLQVAYFFRVIGLFGINIYLLAELVLVTSCLNFSRRAEFLIIGLTTIAIVFDMIIYGSPESDRFVYYPLYSYTAYVRNDPYRHLFHYAYLTILIICMLIIATVWAINVKYHRDKKLVVFAFLSNIIWGLSSVPDWLKLHIDTSLAHVYYCFGWLL